MEGPHTILFIVWALLELTFDPQSPLKIAGDHVLIPFRTIYLEP